MRLVTWLERVWPILVLSVAALALLVTVLTYGMALHSPELSGLGNLRNLHAVLMAGGVLLALNGALLPWRAAHIAAQSVSAAALIAGGVVIYTWIERTSVSGEHLFATHEVLGFCVLVVLSLHWLAAVAIAFFARRSSAAWWTQQHRLGGLFVQVGGVAAVATGVTTFQQMLDLSTFPYVAHQLRYGFVYVGLNVFVLLLILLAGFVIYARRQGDGMHAETSVSESTALLN